MLSIIGFSAVWIIANLFIRMLLVRITNGLVSDAFADFNRGFTLGPLGVLLGLRPSSLAEGQWLPLTTGGAIGSFVAYHLYNAYYEI